MLYPVYVHKDEDSAFGATIPDFPGCFSAADNWEDLTTSIQEAVEVYCDGEDFAIPEPSSPDDYEGNPDFKGGTWVFVDIDTDSLNTKAVRLNISLPLNLVRKVDAHVKTLGTDRSKFLADAARKSMSSVELATSAKKVAASKRTPTAKKAAVKAKPKARKKARKKSA